MAAGSLMDSMRSELNDARVERDEALAAHGAMREQLKAMADTLREEQLKTARQERQIEALATKQVSTPTLSSPKPFIHTHYYYGFTMSVAR